jgi:hypothetical protein
MAVHFAGAPRRNCCIARPAGGVRHSQIAEHCPNAVRCVAEGKRPSVDCHKEDEQSNKHANKDRKQKEAVMGFGRGLLFWLLGIPIPIIILLALFWHN